MPETEPKPLEARLRVLEDERELRDLLSRYSFTADLGRTAEYADLYTDDGAINLRDMGLKRFEGKQMIHDEFINGPNASSRFGKAFHHAAPTVFHIEGDDAEGEGYSIMMVLQDDGSITIAHANYSHWTFRRVDGQWRIVERNIRLIGSPEAAEIFTRTLV